MVKGIGFIVYAVTDMPRARKFYEGVLGLKTNSEYDGTKSENWIEYAIGNDTLSIGCSPDWKPSTDGAVAALEVDNFDEMIASFQKAGVSFKMTANSFPTCDMAVIQDPDKNSILIHQKK